MTPPTPATPSALHDALPYAQQLAVNVQPDWMRQASPATLAHMRQAGRQRQPWFEQACLTQPTITAALMADHAEGRAAQTALRDRLAALPNLERHARERLSHALAERFGLTLDVGKTYLLNAAKAVAYKLSLDGDPLVAGQRALKLATQSLLHCALQNFEASEAQPGGMDEGALKAVVLDSDEFIGLTATGQTVALTPHAFAALCRELDLGGGYQSLVEAACAPVVQGDDPFEQVERATWRQQVHLALLQGHIDPEQHRSLLDLAEHDQAEYQESPVRCNILQLFSTPLLDALVIGAVRYPSDQMHYELGFVPYKDLLVTYLPGADVALKAHESVFAMQTYLREQLLRMDKSALLRLLPAERTQAFLQKLEQTLKPLTWNAEAGVYQPVIDEQAWVEVRLQPFQHAFLTELAWQKRQRLQDDALFHAVPTALEDRKSAARRQAYFTNLALQTVGLLAFTVPGLGPLMLGLSVVQLSYEVYEGLESWAQNEQEQAFDYLMDVLENVAQAAVLGAAGAEIGHPALTQEALPAPAFIEDLEPVERSDGATVLWRPDLRPFAHDAVLPADLQPGADGLYHYQDKTWLAFEDRLYCVKQDAATGQYRLAHPTKARSHEPQLRHNGNGTWLHPLDRPQQWQGHDLFRRLGASAARFDEQTAARILSVSDLSETALRGVLSEQRPLPGLLRDTLLRFELDRDLRLTQSETDRQTRLRLFAERYRARSASQTPGVALLQRLYPDLPSAVCEEVLGQANADERQRLNDNRVPARLGEELRAYQQQVRLARAYEGLYLDSVRNPDSDRLALHSLARWPDWPIDLSVELISDHAAIPIERVGADDAPRRLTLIASTDGYRLLDEPEPLHPSLEAALYEGLHPIQREALGLPTGDAPTALRQRLQQGPELPREDLRKVLGMRPARPGYRSPMRLADGRLGYPLGHTMPPGVGPSRRALVDLIRQLNEGVANTHSIRQIISTLEERGLNRADILARLQELLVQRNTLDDRFEQWRQAARHNPDQAPPDLEQQLAHIRQHWYDSMLAPIDGPTLPLRLTSIDLADFPLHLPSAYTSTVRHLELVDSRPATFAGWHQHEQQLAHLVRQFPALRVLDIRRTPSVDAGPSAFLLSLPLIAANLPELEVLSLTHQSISLSSSDIDSLRQLPHLRRLNLSGNRLSPVYPPEFSGLTLDYLGLDQMNLDHWPEGLDQQTLTQVGELSLRGNQIRSLPAFLLENELPPNQHPHISLQGNPIDSSHLQRVLMNEDGRATHFHIDLAPELQSRLSHLHQRRQQLRGALDDWASASSSRNTVSTELMLSRQRISSAINRFWHDIEQGLSHAPLRLDSIDLAHLPPQLPDFFCDSVRTLILSRVSGSTEQLRHWLNRFPHLTRLTLDEYVAAPADLLSAVAHLPELSELTVRDSEVVIDQALFDQLAPLTKLSCLDLSGNRLGDIEQVPASLRSLQRLDLNNLQLEQWPEWVDSLLPLEMLDLSDNHLTTLPEHVLSNLDNHFPISSISLFGNPLTDDSILRARTSSTSQHSYTFAMDIPEHLLRVGSSDEGSVNGHLHNPLLDPAADAPRLEDWLLGNDLQNEALQDAWHTLSGMDDARNLLSLVGRLRQAAPYRDGQTRPAFAERVRKVLVQALVDPHDRQLINAIAEEALLQPDTGNQTCHDGVLLVFQNIELLISSQHLGSRGADTTEQLYNELRRLFRLHELERLGLANAERRDEAEVRLIYRSGLNRDLDLGVPKDAMLYAPWAHLQGDELTRVMGSVQRAERGEDFLRYAAGNSQWVERLRQEHAHAFAAIEQEFRDQVRALEERKDLSLEELLKATAALEREKKMRVQRLIRDLTIAANPDRP
ncbi:dermonecrotic toxin domain-containing protein [Pseudomonas sp. UBA6562]|uniref:dermonecrotic toxin domain-containing protein n=1 Tax=Pseudomonas sp. UBA6562 TaxID=1947332 RepID=UPI0025DCA627|nr:DUF6543 domain-containing protein [Pseudomonas sp. UBA6562]